MHLPIKWEPKHTVWVIFWYYFAWAHCDRFSWEQQFIESSQWLSPDFSLHPWQLFYLLARLLTALSVHFSSKQSDPGSDRSSIRGSTVQTPPPPLGRALQRQRIDPAAVGPPVPAVQHKQRRSQWRPGIIVIHLHHRCPPRSLPRATQSTTAALGPHLKSRQTEKRSCVTRTKPNP